jgi:hypothetical protein
VALVHPESLPAAGSKGHHTNQGKMAAALQFAEKCSQANVSTL